MSIVPSILAGLLGALLLEWLEVPAGALIGAMLGAIALNLLGGEAVAVHPAIRFGAYAVIGWVLGYQVTWETLHIVRRAIVPILVIVVTLLVTGALIAVVLRTMGIDAATAYLAASPGGISQMAAIVADVGGIGPLVVTAHLVRIITVIVTAPIVVRILGS